MNRPQDTLSRGEYVALAGFRYGLRKFLRFSKEFLDQHKLTPEQYEALLATHTFSDHNGMLVGQLSERLQVRHHTTVALSNKLVDRGLVTKRRGRADRRHVYIKLTAKGEGLLRKLAAVHRQAIRDYSAELIEALKSLQGGRGAA
jgi:DNA-binding MarR family transcriptional regulator